MFVSVYKMLRFDAIDVHMRKRYTKSEFNKNEKQNVLHTTPFVVLHKQTCRIYDIRGDRWNVFCVFGFVALFVICVYGSSSCVSHVPCRDLFTFISVDFVLLPKNGNSFCFEYGQIVYKVRKISLIISMCRWFFFLVSSLLYVCIARNNRIVVFFFEMKEKKKPLVNVQIRHSPFY